jgi:glucosamine--fructose-6-phosphate aminotransferase (isomerizing)
VADENVYTSKNISKGNKMCGIVGATAQRNVVKILLTSLKRLEYRGYDSAGISVVTSNKDMQTIKKLGKVIELEKNINNISGTTGIAHTRWATHGKPSEKNAHPHVSHDTIALVHNGIIENHLEIKKNLEQKGYFFNSDTDTEVIAHLLYDHLKTSSNLLDALQKTIKKLQGAYSIVAFDKNNPEELVAARSGSPLVIGLGVDEHFIASDQLALYPVTRSFIFLEEGDTAKISCSSIQIYNKDLKPINRKTKSSDPSYENEGKGGHKHYMIKEIKEQPEAIYNTIQGKLENNKINFSLLKAEDIAKLKNLKAIQIVACGTSYHGAMVARYWFEEFINVPCRVEIASEFRYRKFFVPEDCLFVTISQSGETADTLAALKLAKTLNYTGFLSICNVFGSSMTRESDLSIMTCAGAEIGVASTKAFTTQLTVLLTLVAAIGELHNIECAIIANIANNITKLPQQIEQILKLENSIKSIAEEIADKQHCLFLGRGSQYPIAMEGALKLKEITYIHAEAYAAGELKHGPLALVDEGMPVIIVAPSNDLLKKLKANMEEVKARGGKLIVFTDTNSNILPEENVTVVDIGNIPEITSPILFTIPLQLLSYFVAIIKGTDVDQPRNLAKSVTVE